MYWIITGLIRKQDIDWVPTLFQQAHPDYEDEAEVRVVPGSPVKVVGLERGPEGRGFSNAQYEEVPMRQPVMVKA